MMRPNRHAQPAKTTGESSTTGEQVVIVEYNPLWPLLFAEEKARILALLSPWVEGVEHIGSTSVTGLGAKPIIDIMVGITHLAAAPECIRRLEAIGYEYVPKHEAVMPERRYFHKGPRQFARTHHLHMVETTSAFWDEHLLFRDYLRAHPATAREYYDLKQQLAARFRSDRGAYTDAKTSFIERVIRQAWEKQSLLYDRDKEF
jgi:GrpB-like predicted nucleotidyltransferase (UPF0157 family)